MCKKEEIQCVHNLIEFEETPASRSRQQQVAEDQENFVLPHSARPEEESLKSQQQQQVERPRRACVLERRKQKQQKEEPR